MLGDVAERPWRGWLFVLVALVASVIGSVLLAGNSRQLIILDDHPWIACLPAACGLAVLVWYSASQRQRHEHLILVVVVGSIGLLATTCLGVGATILKDATSSTEQSLLTDGSEHSVVRRTVLDDATSSTCVEFEFRTGEGLLDRHWTETFCGQELVAATPRLFDDALALERTDGPPCAFQIDWRALKLAPPSPVGCDSTEG